MKVLKIEEVRSEKLIDGTLPDIDSDFAARDRHKVKSYIEHRFGETQVISVGSFTSMKLKGAIKDLDRQFDNDFNNSNIMTAIIPKDDKTMLHLYRTAAKEPRLKQYIKQQSDIFNLMPTILAQPKAKSVHPCAMIIFPSLMSSDQWCPVRKQKGQIVSEWDGYQMDDAGFLKEDVLGIKQLDKFTDMKALIETNGGEFPSLFNTPHDPEVYRYFSNGWNGDVFQLGSEGLTEYTKLLKPTSIHDIIAAVAIFRPGPMNNHYHTIYTQCKNDGREPTYLWHTEEITKDTFGLLVYQEQIMEVCKQLGGLTMKEADDVRRAMGKTKVEVLIPWKGRVGKGFMERGCTEEVFNHIWDVMLEFAKYSFNKSHSAVYAKTGYASMYLKVNFPLEYWTVALAYADEKEVLRYLAEIFAAKKIEILPPDINDSGNEMVSNYVEKSIFWGLGSIKGIGEDTAIQIINERKKGKYTSFANFLFRHSFKGSKVKKQTYEALISAGAFDRLYGFEGAELKRASLIRRFRVFRKVKPAKPERDPYTVGQLDKNWWWLLKQKELTGLAYIKYSEIAKQLDLEGIYATPADISQSQGRGIFRGFGGYVVECRLGRSKNGKYARLTIENNYRLFKIVIWTEEYLRFEKELKECEKSIVVFTGLLKFEPKWTKGNQFTLTEESVLKILKS